MAPYLENDEIDVPGSPESYSIPISQGSGNQRGLSPEGGRGRLTVMSAVKMIPRRSGILYPLKCNGRRRKRASNGLKKQDSAGGFVIIVQYGNSAFTVPTCQRRMYTTNNSRRTLAPLNSCYSCWYNFLRLARCFQSAGER